MTIVVGAAPGQDNSAAVELGIVMARTYRKTLTVAAISSTAWPPSRDKIDAEYQAHIRRIAEATLDQARDLVPSDIEADYLVRGAGSSRRGLLEVSESVGAHRLVVGPAADGRYGRIALGSVSNGLLHSAELPVALAPAGYRAEAGAKLQRISAAYSGSSTSAGLIVGAAMVSAESDVPFRIVSFAPRPRVLSAASIGLNAESHVVDEWAEVVREHTDKILCSIDQLDIRPGETDVAVGTGPDWSAALNAVEWKHPEVMMLGSSGLGALKRVSLGSHAMRILQNSPVPVVVVPRRAKESYMRGR
ncbi:universal stress protein [Brevibacterium renqingii]|uniref:universal stress protein n=1 Tax=Brevibacterium renqingii TaxID=2776916 RepID=UPI001AE0DE39|nr:universal stress protein [Brevibacterium renqingii]